MFYAFGEYVLDPQRYLLYQSGRPLQLWPKVFQVLDYFITHRDRVISKSELAAHVWPDTFVSDAVLENTVRAVRRALGDNASVQRYIETRRGHGYRFVANVTSRETVVSWDNHNRVIEGVGPYRMLDIEPKMAS